MRRIFGADFYLCHTLQVQPLWVCWGSGSLSSADNSLAHHLSLEWHDERVVPSVSMMTLPHKLLFGIGGARRDEHSKDGERQTLRTCYAAHS